MTNACVADCGGVNWTSTYWIYVNVYDCIQQKCQENIYITYDALYHVSDREISDGGPNQNKWQLESWNEVMNSALVVNVRTVVESSSTKVKRLLGKLSDFCKVKRHIYIYICRSKHTYTQWQEKKHFAS